MKMNTQIEITCGNYKHNQDNQINCTSQTITINEKKCTEQLLKEIINKIEKELSFQNITFETSKIEL